jgi:hypothetical protein
MRREYTREALAEADVDADPVVQFRRPACSNRPP